MTVQLLHAIELLEKVESTASENISENVRDVAAATESATAAAESAAKASKIIRSTEKEEPSALEKANPARKYAVSKKRKAMEKIVDTDLTSKSFEFSVTKKLKQQIIGSTPVSEEALAEILNRPITDAEKEWEIRFEKYSKDPSSTDYEAAQALIKGRDKEITSATADLRKYQTAFRSAQEKISSLEDQLQELSTAFSPAKDQKRKIQSMRTALDNETKASDTLQENIGEAVFKIEYMQAIKRAASKYF